MKKFNIFFVFSLFLILTFLTSNVFALKSIYLSNDIFYEEYTIGDWVETSNYVLKEKNQILITPEKDKMFIDWVYTGSSVFYKENYLLGRRSFKKSLLWGSEYEDSYKKIKFYAKKKGIKDYQVITKKIFNKIKTEEEFVTNSGFKIRAKYGTGTFTNLREHFYRQNYEILYDYNLYTYRLEKMVSKLKCMKTKKCDYELFIELGNIVEKLKTTQDLLEKAIDDYSFLKIQKTKDKFELRKIERFF